MVKTCETQYYYLRLKSVDMAINSTLLFSLPPYLKSWLHPWEGRASLAVFWVMKELPPTLHEYGYEYRIQYVSDTRIHTFSKENPLKWCI